MRGGYLFTHAAALQTRIAVRKMPLPSVALTELDERMMPWTTFTEPEITHVGLTEAEARQVHGNSVRMSMQPPRRLIRSTAFVDVCAYRQPLRTFLREMSATSAVGALPAAYRKRLRTANGQERLNEEIRRRERVIRIFPNRESAMRLLGALLMEQDEAWSTGKRYLDMTAYWQWRAASRQDAQEGGPTLTA